MHGATEKSSVKFTVGERVSPRAFIPAKRINNLFNEPGMSLDVERRWIRHRNTVSRIERIEILLSPRDPRAVRLNSLHIFEIGTHRFKLFLTPESADTTR